MLSSNSPEFKHTILTKLKKSYTRNNKDPFSKRVRCFPDCCKNGHKNRSYCGRPIFARLVASTNQFVNTDASLSVYCRIKPRFINTKDIKIFELNQRYDVQSLLDEDCIEADIIIKYTHVMDISIIINDRKSFNYSKW